MAIIDATRETQGGGAIGWGGKRLDEMLAAGGRADRVIFSGVGKSRGEMRAGTIDVSSQVKKQIGISHRNDARCPIDVIQIGLQALHAGGSQFREQRLIDNSEPSI